MLISTEFADNFEQSWLFDELFRSRNFGPAMHKFGSFWGGAFNTLDQNIFAGKLPFTLKDNTVDHLTLRPAAEAPKIQYAKPDNAIELLLFVVCVLSNTNHEEDQPCHLKLADDSYSCAGELSLVRRTCTALLPGWGL